MKRLLFTLGLAFFCVTAAAASSYGPEKLSDPALEARAVALQRGFRCLVCQGESLDESNAELADDLRRLIRAHILSGESDAQITEYLVERYGNVILMKPPLETDTLALWFGPLLILAVGGMFVGFVVLRARRKAHSHPHA